MKSKALRLFIGLISVLAIFTAVSSAAYACPTLIFFQPKTPESLIIKD